MTKKIYAVYQDFRENISLIKAFWTKGEAQAYAKHEWDTDTGLASFGVMEVEIGIEDITDYTKTLKRWRDNLWRDSMYYREQNLNKLTYQCRESAHLLNYVIQLLQGEDISWVIKRCTRGYGGCKYGEYPEEWCGK